MPIVIDGSGTVTGIGVGGLPTGIITSDEIAANAVTAAKLGTNEASGLCKAWVNFNGIGTVTIRASYNVSSITDSGAGLYGVNFITALADANYTVAGSARDESGGFFVQLSSLTNSTATIGCVRVSPLGLIDSAIVSVAIFR